MRDKQLGNTVVNGARKVLTALQENISVPRENAKLIKAMDDPRDDPTFAGMKKGFQEQAKMVGKEGIFFFHFSGHGIKLGGDQFGLAPMDFDSENTCVTASVLSQWLNESSCVAKCIVCTIDCCYAGGLAEALTHDPNTLTQFPLYVMAACTANEKSSVLYVLNTTIYCPSLMQFRWLNALSATSQSDTYMRSVRNSPLLSHPCC